MLKSYQSQPKNNYFAPEWRFDFFEVCFSDKDKLNEIASIVLDKEPKLISQFQNIKHDGGTGLGPFSLTSRFPYFNIFDWPEKEFKELKDFVFEHYHNFLKDLEIKPESAFISGWANVMRQGQQIQPHWHSCFADSYLGGHFIVSADQTSTYYRNPYNINEIFEFPNEPGNLTFFPNYLVHWTDVHRGEQPRITLAFDIITKNYKEKFPKESERYIKI